MTTGTDQRTNPSPASTVLLTGSSGLIGTSLMAALRDTGRRVVPLVRQHPAPPECIAWDPLAARMDPAPLAGADTVIHLAGENLAGKRWTAARKQRIWDSRVRSTTLLAETIAQLRPAPRTFICASAIGFYGDRGDEELTEDLPPGKGFIADLCQQWEQACTAASAAGIRVVHLRFGVVLTPSGGALAQMLPLFKLGLGGPVGNGRQYLGWISLDDLVAAVMHLLNHSALAGPVNMVAPQSVTFHQLARTLGHVLHRPAFFGLPAPLARLAIGEMADVLLASTRVIPRRLEEDGFRFQHPELEGALRQLLGKG